MMALFMMESSIIRKYTNSKKMTRLLTLVIVNHLHNANSMALAECMGLMLGMVRLQKRFDRTIA